jgi:TPR repeat protein
MACSLFIAVLVTGLVIDQAATPSAQGQTEAPARLSSAQISQLRVKAETGDPAARRALGRAYEDGNGVPQSDEQAVEWYRKAAEQGNAAAQNDLGLMYLAGRGVEKNKEEASKWSHKAARQKYPVAMFNLGAAYYNGDGVDTDVVSAYAWFLLAQEAGSEPAVDAVRRRTQSCGPATRRLHSRKSPRYMKKETIFRETTAKRSGGIVGQLRAAEPLSG